ncbi:ECF RNA polymerase sigma factor SigW [bacterium BMS3Abin01]|nr:ECF RNA polymerase sigma factor SigW [bacterium BMS3Abin01]
MSGADLSDNQLAALAGRGDAEAYRRLFERYQNPVYNFVYRLVNNAEDASDVVQNAFLKMYTVLGERKDVQNFSAYLYRTARNLAYDEMRRRSRYADADLELLAPEDPNIYADPQRALLLQEQMGRVRRAAGRLNENQRAALILRELQDFNYDQMSEVLGSNRNAVGALLSRARFRLREELRMAQVRTEQVPPDCETIIDMLSPYIDDELSGEDSAAVDAHLEDCTFCAAALEEMGDASRSFRMLIPVVPPPDLAEAFAGNLRNLVAQSGGASAAVRPVAASPDVAVDGRSLFSRIFHSRIILGTAAAVAVFAIGAFLIAGETGRDNLAFNDESAVGEQPMATPDLPSEGGGLTQEPRPQADEPAVIPVKEPENIPTSPQSTDQPPAGRQQALITIARVSISPNPVWEDSQFTVTAVVQGSAASVTANIQGLLDMPLVYQYSSSGLETWSGTARAAGYGTFPVFINAMDAQGLSVSQNGGNLTVLSFSVASPPQP